MGLLALALAMGGCATHVPQALGPKIVPASFSSEVPRAQQIWPPREWWQSFGCPELSKLIVDAQEQNRDIAVATARMMQARAQLTIERSALWPQLNLTAAAQRSGTGANSVSSSQTIGTSNAGTSNTFGLSAGASYGVDIWGLSIANVRAAREMLKSARYAQESTRLSVAAEVADAYFQILSLRERIAIVQEDIAAVQSILDVIKLKVAAGKSSQLDLTQEQAQMEAIAMQAPLLKEQELEARAALAVLLGRVPEQLQISEQNARSILSPVIAPGIPSELLERRPDVAEAEAALAAAHADVDAARVAFLPQFSLTGSAGYASATLNTLIRGPGLLWDASANLLQTIFDGGKLVGQLRLAQATQRQLIASYESAVLNAFADVDIALGQVASYSAAEEHLVSEVKAASEAFQIGQLQYRQGVADLIIVLQAQLTLFSAQDQLSQAGLSRRQAMVHLYQALGGGWVEPRSERTQLTKQTGS